MGTNTRQISNLQFEKLSNQIVEWQSVVVADGSTGLTAVSGRGYFIDTTSAAQTVTLPASPTIGDTIMIVDYASTFNSNNVTVNPNGNKIEADTSNGTLSTNDQTHTLVFTDSTQGWKIVNQDTASSIQPTFNEATGGTVTTSGDYKIHTFTGDGCFVVSQTANAVGGPADVSYIVVAGGASGGRGSNNGGGGGAGGYREGKDAPSPHTASPLAAGGLPVAAQTYPITVGGGGATTNSVGGGTNGSNSSFSTITSAGGGGGGAYGPGAGGSNGGSGGGEGANAGAGTGNTPPVSPPQGTPGGQTYAPCTGKGQGAGGGAGQPGPNGLSNAGGDGGDGVGTAIGGTSGTPGPNGSLKYFAGGGAGGMNGGVSAGAGGYGGGGGGPTGNAPGGAATANTGGGGGGNGHLNGVGGAGGKGIVIIRYKFQ